MRGLGIGVGDEVIIQGYTFIATLSSIIYVGATPVFCDIDLDTYSMSVESVEEDNSKDKSHNTCLCKWKAC